jgi:multisubunit Na+/H+ antiporter MnhB subunit
MKRGGRSRSPASLAVGVACAALAAALMRVVWTLDGPPGLAPRVEAELPVSGVRSGVTAVLLDFRAYDTLLEVAVLVAAAVAIWSLERGRPASPPPLSTTAEPVLTALLRGVVPVIVLASVYLVWRGSHAPGGAFQGGALLGGATVLLLAAGVVRAPAPTYWPVRAAVTVGLGAFVALAAGTLAASGSLLRYPAGAAYPMIVALELVVAFSIAAILADLFVDVPAVDQDSADGDDVEPTPRAPDPGPGSRSDDAGPARGGAAGTPDRDSAA